MNSNVALFTLHWPMEVRGWALVLFFLATALLDYFLVAVIHHLEAALATEAQRADYAMRQLEELRKLHNAGCYMSANNHRSS
jgi:hypothetical protein